MRGIIGGRLSRAGTWHQIPGEIAFQPS